MAGEDIPAAATPLVNKLGVPVRGTQTFVGTLSACWRRPSITAVEVLWRWVYGVPALALVVWEGNRILYANRVNAAALSRMSVMDPMAAVATLTQAWGVLEAPVHRAVVGLGPAMVVAWVVVSSLGRTMMLRRADARLHSRTETMIWLQTLRTAALGVSLWVWFLCLRGAVGLAINGPIAAGQEPNLVLYCALAIVATLGLFMLWAVLSWGLSVAPLLAMRLDLGTGESLRAAFGVGPLKSKLVEINLVMGIVKIALIVLALVFSATPLPFESVATPEFMMWWYAGVTVIYLVASDFFHVVRLMAYLELWEALGEP